MKSLIYIFLILVIVSSCGQNLINGLILPLGEKGIKIVQCVRHKTDAYQFFWDGHLVGHLALTKDGQCADLFAVATMFGLEQKKAKNILDEMKAIMAEAGHH